MSTMNISLPDELKSFVDSRIQAEGYGSSSEYLRELIRRNHDRSQFRRYLMDGVNAESVGRLGVMKGQHAQQRTAPSARPLPYPSPASG